LEYSYIFFLYNPASTLVIYTLSLHDALPISQITPLWTRLACVGGPTESRQEFRLRSRAARRLTEPVACSAYSPRTSTRSPRTELALLGIPTSDKDARDPAAYSAVRSRTRPSDHTRTTSRTSRNRGKIHRRRKLRARPP